MANGDEEEPIYKEYVDSDGKVLRLTKTEFDRVVDVFRKLDRQAQRLETTARLLRASQSNEVAASQMQRPSDVAGAEQPSPVARTQEGSFMTELRDIGDRLVDFSAAVIKMLHNMPASTIGKKIEDQMVRSAMSAGANYEEARGADSRADFCNKLQISLKEMRETRYWLRLTEKAGLVEGDVLKNLVMEATELRAILAKSVATARGKARIAEEEARQRV